MTLFSACPTCQTRFQRLQIHNLEKEMNIGVMCAVICEIQVNKVFIQKHKQAHN